MLGDDEMDELFGVSLTKNDMPTMLVKKPVVSAGIVMDDLFSSNLKRSASVNTATNATSTEAMGDINFDTFKINLVPQMVQEYGGKTIKRVPYAGGDYFGFCYMTEHLSKPEGFLAFQSLLEAHWAQENLCFWKRVEELHKCGPDKITSTALSIFNDHCKIGCPMPLNVSGPIMESVRKILPHMLRQNTFDDLQIDVSKSMQLNYWNLYMHSSYHVMFLEAKFRLWKLPVPKDKKKRRKPATYETDQQNVDDDDFYAEDNPFETTSEESSVPSSFSTRTLSTASASHTPCASDETASTASKSSKPKKKRSIASRKPKKDKANDSKYFEKKDSKIENKIDLKLKSLDRKNTKSEFSFG